MAAFGALLGPSDILTAAVLAAVAGALLALARRSVEATRGGDSVCAGNRRGRLAVLLGRR